MCGDFVFPIFLAYGVAGLFISAVMMTNGRGGWPPFGMAQLRPESYNSTGQKWLRILRWYIRGIPVLLAALWLAAGIDCVGAT
jgi:hypothetical protein